MTCIHFPMEDSQGGSTVQNTNDILPGQENKEASVFFSDPDLLLGSPSSFPCPEHHAYKPLRIFHRTSYKSQKHVEQLTLLKLQRFFFKSKQWGS